MTRLPARQPTRGAPAVSASARDYAVKEKADNTRHAYQKGFRLFRAWCQGHEREPLPASPETVADFLASEAERGAKASTLGLWLAAIVYAHRLAGHVPSPTSAEPVKAVLRGIRRTIHTAPIRKAAATTDLVFRMLAACPTDTFRGMRDRALLALGFAAALRRSELAALTVDDLTFTREGVLVRLVHSKTDQEGHGETIAVLHGTKLYPVQAVRDWLAVAKIAHGPMFRGIDGGGHVMVTALTVDSVALIVKRRAEAAGLDPAVFSGHSLRAGLVTSAVKRDAKLFKVMEITRHRSVNTVQGYAREVDKFSRDHAGRRGVY
jgi:integrase